MKYRLSPEAERDINEIWEYIAEDNPTAADNVINTIQDALATISKSPGLGRKRPEIPTKAPARYWTVYRHYVIAYLEDSKPLYVLRVVSGYRDLPALFAVDTQI